MLTGLSNFWAVYLLRKPSLYFAENCEYDFDKTNFMVDDPVFCHFTTTKEKQELRTINPWPAVGPRHAK